MKKYLVGGAVRDKLLGKEPSDLDYVITGATEDDMIALRYKKVGNSFPVYLDNLGNEIALARKEIKTGSKHTDFNCSFLPTTTIEEDLERRDFTINAIAYDEEKNSYIDPFNGIEDIKNKKLRIVSKEHFAEDPLRLLRAARFLTSLKDFTMDDKDSLDAIKDIVKSGDLIHLSKERIWKELEKVLNEDRPSIFFEFLDKVGALKVLFPLIHSLTKTIENVKYHPSGFTFKHTMSTIDYISHTSAITKFAMLLHDVGKTSTPDYILPKHIDHDIRGIQLVDDFCKDYKIPTKFKDFAILVCKTHMRFHYFADMKLKKKYDLIKDISKSFKDFSLVDDSIKCYAADLIAEKYDLLYDIADLKSMHDFVLKTSSDIFAAAKSFKLSDVQIKTLDKFKGMPKYGDMYDMYRFDYVRDIMKG